jgi:hypothetical protein
VPESLFDLQRQVLTRQQLIVCGVSDDRIRAQVEADRWRQLTPTVFVLHNGPLTLEQQWWAATLAVGPLAGRSALQAWGVTGWDTKGVEVLVRRGEHPPLPHGVPVVVHESRRFTAADVHPVREPRRVGVARAAVDAAAWTMQPRAAAGLLAAVVQQGKTSAKHLLGELRDAGAVRHCRLIRTVLQDIEGGAQALTEVDLARVCRRYGLLVPERQVVRLDSHGKRRYVDARVSAPNGRSVLVEVDGALHLVATTYWQDMLRLNEILIRGVPVLRFPSVALHLDEATVGNQLRRACGLDPVRLAA